jgi:flagellar biosynthesis GTPase FlhF
MKCVTSFSLVALVSFLNATPGFAIAQSSSSQTSDNRADTIQLAGIFDVIDRGLNIIDRERQREEARQKREQQEIERQEREAARERERQERLEAQKKREEEFAAARKKATEQQRLEADRRQKYFDSLSPEQQKAYIAEQRAKQERASEMAAKLFMMVVESASRPNLCRRGSWFTGYTYYEC